MNGFVFVGGLLGVGVGFPFLLFQLGKCHMKRELRKNILKLEEINESSSEEISALIQIHFEELKKLDEGLFVRNSVKNKNL